ncbi:unnamed protein product [Chondrus crispus]|uniref:Uncharacterized protein n=1 Tax=Chondrus crispus TaxID=2769 RepID=R7Q7L6_CHOCR|nr:unnamed protein product [Chondrus crispus]CDF34517.1 unnamed protein product [Chondrus crispus]|eukprot:XP_005714336.1 unnamed protein product [Chondrus crispus]
MDLQIFSGGKLAARIGNRKIISPRAMHSVQGIGLQARWARRNARGDTPLSDTIL